MKSKKIVTKKSAEKLFNKKADADSNLSAKAFLKKKASGMVSKKKPVSKGFNAKKYETERKKVFRLPSNY